MKKRTRSCFQHLGYCPNWSYSEINCFRQNPPEPTIHTESKERVGTHQQLLGCQKSEASIKQIIGEAPKRPKVSRYYPPTICLARPVAQFLIFPLSLYMARAFVPFGLSAAAETTRQTYQSAKSVSALPRSLPPQLQKVGGMLSGTKEGNARIPSATACYRITI